MAFVDTNEDTLGSLSRKYSFYLYPRTMNEVLEWATDMWLHDGLYTQTIRKGVRYFMTEMEITDASSTNVSDAYKNYFDKHYDILEEAAKVGDEAIGFGNAFTSIYIPIRRVLSCKHCGAEFNYSRIKYDVKFHHDSRTFTGKCPVCKRSGSFKRKDIHKSVENSPPKILRWDPSMIGITYNSMTDKHEYTLKPNNDSYFAQRLRKGDPFFLEDTPWEIIEAICSNNPIKFKDDNIFHMKMDPPSFMKQYTRGWGIPPFMSDFGTVVLLKMLDRYNEAILSDYTMPIRSISPANMTGTSQSSMMGADLMSQVDFNTISSSIENMVEESRRDPTKMHASPFPLNYQIMGGEAKQLVPVEIQQHYRQQLLQNIGFPLEFIQNSIRQSAGPLIGFSIFERTWQHFANSLNSWLTWVGEKVSDIRQWEKVKIRTVPSSMYEDPKIKEMKLQLASARQISMTDGLKALGLDYREQQEKIMEEQKRDMDRQQEFQDDMQARGANMAMLRTPPAGIKAMQEQQGAMGAPPGGGGAAPGGAPGGGSPAGGPGGDVPGGGSGPMENPSLTQMDQQAEQLANELFAADDTTRRSKLIELEDSNPHLHALVTQKLEDIRQDAQRKGQIMASQEAQQSAGPAGSGGM